MTVREPVNPEKPDPDNLCFQICHIESIIDIKCSSTTERFGVVFSYHASAYRSYVFAELPPCVVLVEMPG